MGSPSVVPSVDVKIVLLMLLTYSWPGHDVVPDKGFLHFLDQVLYGAS